MTALAEWSESLHVTGDGVCAFRDRFQIHVRSFAPAHGIPEDPVRRRKFERWGVFKNAGLSRFGRLRAARNAARRDGRCRPSDQT
jgi:hypothetical protein